MGMLDSAPVHGDGRVVSLMRMKFFVMSPIEGNFSCLEAKSLFLQSKVPLRRRLQQSRNRQRGHQAQRRAVHLRQCRARTAISRSLADVSRCSRRCGRRSVRRIDRAQASTDIGICRRMEPGCHSRNRGIDICRCSPPRSFVLGTVAITVTGTHRVDLYEVSVVVDVDMIANAGACRR